MPFLSNFIQTSPAPNLSITQDLENLLNTRCSNEGNNKSNKTNSLLDYGIPDFSKTYYRWPSQQHVLCNEIATAIQTFIPYVFSSVVKPELSDTDETLCLTIKLNLNQGVLNYACKFSITLGEYQIVTIQPVARNVHI